MNLKFAVYRRTQPLLPSPERAQRGPSLCASEDIPGDPQRSEVAKNLTVTGGTPGELDLEWEGGLRAERYQVEVLVAGQDTEFRRVDTVKDERVTLTGLLPGAEVQVRVTGANKVGEGAPCEPVSLHVPALAVAAQGLIRSSRFCSRAASRWRLPWLLQGLGTFVRGWFCRGCVSGGGGARIR